MKKYNLLGKEVLRDHGDYNALEEVIITRKMKWRWFIATTFCTIIVLNILAVALFINEKEAQKRIRIGTQIYHQQQVAKLNDSVVTYRLKSASHSYANDTDIKTASLTPANAKSVDISNSDTSQKKQTPVKNHVVKTPVKALSEIVHTPSHKVKKNHTLTEDTKTSEINKSHSIVKLTSKAKTQNETISNKIVKIDNANKPKLTVKVYSKDDKKIANAHEAKHKDKFILTTKTDTSNLLQKHKEKAINPLETVLRTTDHFLSNEKARMSANMLIDDKGTIASIITEDVFQKQEHKEKVVNTTTKIASLIKNQEKHNDDQITTGAYHQPEMKITNTQNSITSIISQDMPIVKVVNNKNKNSDTKKSLKIQKVPSKNVKLHDSPNIDTILSQTVRKTQKIKIQSGQSLSGILRKQKTVQNTINTIISAINGKFDPRGFQAGESIYIVYNENRTLHKIYLPQLNKKYLMLNFSNNGSINSQIVTNNDVKNLRINS